MTIQCKHFPLTITNISAYSSGHRFHGKGILECGCNYESANTNTAI